jgi:hypothetical protein
MPRAREQEWLRVHLETLPERQRQRDRERAEIQAAWRANKEMRDLTAHGRQRWGATGPAHEATGDDPRLAHMDGQRPQP